MTRASELRELDSAELGDRLAGARKELFNLRFQLATGRLDNISRIGAVRREIARIITLEVERGAGGPAPDAVPGRATAGGSAASAVSGARAVSAAAGGKGTEEER
jgi:large subunit ribosomal protein L29